MAWAVAGSASASTPPPSDSCGPGTPQWPSASEALAIPDSSVIPLDPNTLPSNDLVGTILGEAGVDAGIGSYSVPIEIPPGRAGMQPTVALQYSSAGAGGLAGYGWSLHAAARLHRCRLYPDTDGIARPVVLDSQDALCLNGQRLVLVSGSYGTWGAEYRTEVDSFARVRQLGSTSDVNGCFTVEEKNGRVSYYGGCLGSNAVEVPPGRPVPLSWAIARVEDRAANQVDFRYEVVLGQHRLHSIEYTGFQGTAGSRSVRLHYDVRPDVAVGYFPQHPIWRNGGNFVPDPSLRDRTTNFGAGRLTAIETWVGEQRVRRYQLEHTVSPATGRSLLSALRLCTDSSCTDSNSLPATRFTYQGDVLHTPPELMPETLHWRIATVGDYDGDGVADRVRRRYPEVYGGGQPLESYLDLSSGLSIDLAGHAWASSLAGTEADLRIVGEANRDFDGDGRVDIEGRSAAGYFAVGTIDSAGLLTVKSSNLHLGPAGSVIEARADFDLDGRLDLLMKDNGAFVVHHQCSEAGAPALDFCRTTFGGYADSHQHVSATPDLDGNGYPDLLVTADAENYYDDDGEYRYGFTRVYFFDEGGYATNYHLRDLAVGTMRWNDGATSHHLADVNGDGLPDILQLSSAIHWPSGGGVPVSQAPDITVYINEGGNFRPVPLSGSLYPPQVRKHVQRAIMVGDFDADGRPELLVPAEVRAAFCYLAGAGSGGEPKEYCSSPGHALPFSLAGAPRSHDRTIYRWNLVDIVFDPASPQHPLADEAYALVHRPLDLELPLYAAVPTDANGDGQTDFQFRISDVYGMTGAGSVPLGYYVPATRPVHGNYLTRFESGAPDLMTSATNGLGRTSRFFHHPLSSVGHPNCTSPVRPEFYRADPSAVRFDGDYSLFQSSLQVVSRFEIDHGSGVNADCFYYDNAWLHRRGRGFQGFERVIREQRYDSAPAEDVRETTTYHVRRPLAGRAHRLEKTRVIDPPGTQPFVVQTTRWAESCRAGGGPRQAASHCFIRPEEKFEATYDLATRVLLGNSTTETTYSATDLVYGNPTGITHTTQDRFHTETFHTLQTYDYSFVNDWWLDPVVERIETYGPLLVHEGLAQPSSPWRSYQIRTAYTYWTSGAGRRKAKTETVQPGHPDQELLRYTVYDGYGQVAATTLTAARSTRPRISIQSYGADGYFLLSKHNGRFAAQYSYEPATGGQLTETDPNGLVASREYDDLGRLLAEHPAVGPSTYHRVVACDASCPAGAVYRNLTFQDGATDTVEYLDRTERITQTQTKTFDGQGMITTYAEYDARGRQVALSAPTANPATRYYTRYSGFDAVGRAAQKVIERADYPSHPSIEVRDVYDGFDTLIEVVGTPTQRLRRQDSRGRTVMTTDARGQSLSFAYGPRNTLELIRDEQGNETVIDYDALGRRLSVDDPDRGGWTFDHNGFGELISQVDANGTVIEIEYDDLGRVTRSLVGGAVETVVGYDRGFKGAVDFERGGSEGLADFCRAYDRDAYGRVRREVTFADTHTFARDFAYDGYFGRVKGQRYPSGQSLRYEYSSQGVLTAEVDHDSGQVLREVTQMDARYTVRRERFGNGLEGLYEYKASSGQVERIRVFDPISEQSGQDFQHLEYRYDDPLHQLSSQINHVMAVQETYTYDDLRRLRATDRRWTDPTVSAPVRVDYDYDPLANLSLKSDYALGYSYGSADKANPANAGPHAIQSFTSASGQVVSDFQYDSNGNQLEGDGRSLTYSAHNRPRSVVRAGLQVRFRYGADQQRYRRDDDDGTRTYSIGGDYEHVEHPNGDLEQRHYVGPSALIVRNNGTPEVRYLHKDRLGSTDTVTDEDARTSRKAVERHGFDPFGAPRDSHWRSVGTLHSGEFNAESTDRGFTGHEHIDEQRLIHMNGRAYDYQLGRFTGVDPVIADIERIDALNPYSYIENNPLAGTDPSGFVADQLDIQIAVTSDPDSGAITAAEMTISAEGASVTIDFVNGTADVQLAPSLAGDNSEAREFLQAFFSQLASHFVSGGVETVQDLMESITSILGVDAPVELNGSFESSLDRLHDSEKDIFRDNPANLFWSGLAEYLTKDSPQAQGRALADMVMGAANTVGTALLVAGIVRALPKIIQLVTKGAARGMELARAVMARIFSTHCFVAGTAVAIATGTAPIETLTVGHRVRTQSGKHDTEVDAAWRVVTLRLRDDTDGDIVHITTLRPPEWLAEHGIDGPGRQLRMSFPELGTAGWATTESIAPAPPLDSGPGRVVLATLRHYNDDVHALRFEQVDDVLEVTGRHPFWSVDRRDWVRVESLYIGERLESRDGVVTVAEIGPVPGRHEVFNLTVEGDHEYLVGPAGVRTHNSRRKNCGGSEGGGGTRFIGEPNGTMVDTHATPPGSYNQPGRTVANGEAVPRTDVLQPSGDHGTGATHTHQPIIHTNPSNGREFSGGLDQGQPVTFDEVQNIMSGAATPAAPRGR